MKTKQKETPVIGIGGGPCAGKTSIFPYLVEHLGNMGYKSYIVPEAATLLINGGMDKRRPDFQEAILNTIIHLENQFILSANNEGYEKTIVLCDRGTLDGLAYTTEDHFFEMIQKYEYTIPEIRDARYKAYIHMKTAADGALEFYTLANNTARDETPEEAIRLDERLQSVWIGHPHLRVIDNSTDFEGKKKRVLKEVCRVLGIPEPLEIERKFLIDPRFTSEQIPVQHADVTIVQHYLEQTEEKNVERVRKRIQFDTPLYIHTTKQSVGFGTNIELEKFITKDEYVELLERQDRSRYPIKKIRSCFLWENQYFEFDSIYHPTTLNLLELEVMNMEDKIKFPPFIPIIKEVTGDSLFSNSIIATTKPRV